MINRLDVSDGRTNYLAFYRRLIEKKNDTLNAIHPWLALRRRAHRYRRPAQRALTRVKRMEGSQEAQSPDVSRQLPPL